MSLFIRSTSPTKSYNDSLLEKAITQAAIYFTQQNNYGFLPSGPSLDINFLISGKYDKPKFSGMRMGNYNDESKTLYFEKVVPEDMLHSSMANAFVSAVLSDVIHNAADYFSDLDIQFDFSSWHKTLAEVHPQTNSLN